eukprot:SAG31_NODE_1027_length_10273_cov_50.715746_8_plen_57_part_00
MRAVHFDKFLQDLLLLLNLLTEFTIGTSEFCTCVQLLLVARTAPPRTASATNAMQA